MPSPEPVIVTTKHENDKCSTTNLVRNEWNVKKKVPTLDMLDISTHTDSVKIGNVCVCLLGWVNENGKVLTSSQECGDKNKLKEKMLNKLTDRSRVCCDKCRHSGMDSFGTPPHRRSTFCPGNLSDNGIWSRHRVMKYMCRHCDTAMMRINFAFHKICLSNETGKGF